MRIFDKAPVDASELEILELLATTPVSYFPPRHVPTVTRLVFKGLAVRSEKAWYPTSLGVEKIGRAMH